MLPFFPAFQEDELLYSAVARYHREAAWGGWSATLEALFGRRHVVASHDLPGHLCALVERLAAGMPGDMTVNRLIDQTTLLPYFASASSPATREKARAAAAVGGGSSYLSMGLAASCVSRIAALRFCPLCKDEDMAAKGLTWWRRSQQLPGTVVCLRHRRPLLETPCAFARLGRHEFLLADDRSCPPTARPLATSEPARVELLLAIARKEKELLETGSLSGSLAEFRRRLAAVGLMRSARRVDQVSLIEQATTLFEPLARHLPTVFSAGALTNWMPTLVRKTRRGHHPLLHVALDVFLDAQRGAASAAADAPFGNGPWECLNPLAPHTGEAVVTDLQSYANKGSLVGRFTCQCEYVYTRGISAAGQLGPPRFARYGPLLHPELRRLVASGASLREVGRVLRLDPNTVVAEAARLKLTVPWRNARTARRARKPCRPFNRVATARGRVAERQPSPRQDWAARDAELLVRFRHAADAIFAVKPPKRLTLAALERAAIGKVGWLARRRDRVPRTTAFVEEVAESTSDYRRRRAAFEIARSETPVLPWRIMRAAGLTGADLPMIRAQIAMLLPTGRCAA